MVEYIEREEATEAAIDAADEWDGGYNPHRAANIRDGINAIPAADVRPVVLCRDCKFTKTDGMEDPAIYCEKWDRWEMPPDGFCWLGKKRKEVIDGN